MFGRNDRSISKQLERMENKIMAAIDDLNTAVTKLQNEDAAVIAQVGVLNTQISTLMASLAAAQNTDPAVEVAATAVMAEVAKLGVIAGVSPATAKP
jgi:delta-aminolevulinic acid dehydratase/porphobilinogen synthase